MNKSRINRLLFFAILVMALLPLVASLYFVNSAVETSLNLGFNQDVIDALDSDAGNLKLLGHLDKEHESQYREQFEQIQNLRTIYGSQEFVRRSVHHSLLIYFSLGLMLAVVVSTIAAALLSRKISTSYRDAHERLTAQNEKIRYLEEISSWQELAKILAHEIKNPLTPIEMLVTSLGKSFREQPADKFAEFMAHTQVVVIEELRHLKNTVQKFSAFAQLPSIHMTKVEIYDVLRQQVMSINHVVQRSRVILAEPSTPNPIHANLDVTLFRQVLNNLVINGVEANVDAVVVFSISVVCHTDMITITVINDGVPVDPAVAMRMFDPYISTKRGKGNANSNMGLGLAIVRKIMLEHSGDIHYEERGGYPAFILTIPRVNADE